MPIENNTIDRVLLVAVLTCIPDNNSQKELIELLYAKLKPGGIIYLSDYFLQDNFSEGKQYEYLNGDLTNFGIFTLPEGAMFRHHTKERISELTKDFEILENHLIEVKTMNGNYVKAFQLILQK